MADRWWIGIPEGMLLLGVYLLVLELFASHDEGERLLVVDLALVAVRAAAVFVLLGWRLVTHPVWTVGQLREQVPR